MALGKTGNQVHDNNVSVAEGMRQVAMTSATTQAQATAADVAFYKAVAASALANNLSHVYGTAIQTLITLGAVAP